MKYWLQSLQDNGFDVFIVVYLALLFIGYHYLLRWYVDIRLKQIEKQMDTLNGTMNEALDEILS